MPRREFTDPATLTYQLDADVAYEDTDGQKGRVPGLYIEPSRVPQVGPVRVLLGEYEGHTSPIPAPSPVVYLDVVLAQGQTCEGRRCRASSPSSNPAAAR